jgi:hypothetical protein
MSQRVNVALAKSALGECTLRLVETTTRDAIKTGAGPAERTIAYVAIGAEAWGPLLACAPELLHDLRGTVYALEALLKDCAKQKDFPRDAALAMSAVIVEGKATIAKAEA